MKIISRYVLRHFFQIFALGLIAFIGLYLIVDFFEKVGHIVEHHFSAIDAGLYFLYKTPMIMNQGVPMAVLMATVITLGILKRNRELIALKTAGIGAGVYAGPIMGAALLLCIVQFASDETMARPLNRKAQEIWQQGGSKGKSPISWVQENVWYRGHNIFYHIRLYDQKALTMDKVSLLFMGPQFKLMRRVDARRLRWTGEGWLAEEGHILDFTNPDVDQEWFQERMLDLREKPEDFSGLDTLPEQLNWLDLLHYSMKIREEGYNSASYEVELNYRAAFPLTTFILALLGVSIALRRKLHDGMAWNTGAALLVAFVYLTVLQIGCSLGTAGALPPIIGVWSGNLIFLALAAFLWITHCE
jgi:lipopolysaccharide export system permease protein